MKTYSDDTLISPEVLKYFGFVCEQGVVEETETDGRWYNDFWLHEDNFSGEFSFAVYVRGDGSLKSGYYIRTVGRLKSLYKGITDKELHPAPIPNKL